MQGSTGEEARWATLSSQIPGGTVESHVRSQQRRQFANWIRMTHMSPKNDYDSDNQQMNSDVAFIDPRYSRYHMSRNATLNDKLLGSLATTDDHRSNTATNNPHSVGKCGLEDTIISSITPKICSRSPSSTMNGDALPIQEEFQAISGEKESGIASPPSIEGSLDLTQESESEGKKKQHRELLQNVVNFKLLQRHIAQQRSASSADVVPPPPGPPSEFFPSGPLPTLWKITNSKFLSHKSDAENQSERPEQTAYENANREIQSVIKG